LYSLSYSQEDVEELENSSEVYNSQDSNSWCSEHDSGLDLVDSDRWTETWGPDDESVIFGEECFLRDRAYWNQTDSSSGLGFNMIDAYHQVPLVEIGVDLIPESASDTDDGNGSSWVGIVAPAIQVLRLDPVEEIVVEPWTQLLPNAEEDELTELPCSFPDFLAFTELGYDAAVKKYLDLILTCVRIFKGLLT